MEGGRVSSFITHMKGIMFRYWFIAFIVCVMVSPRISAQEQKTLMTFLTQDYNDTVLDDKIEFVK